MKIIEYKDIKVSLIRATDDPLGIMSQVSRVMMTTKFKTRSDKVTFIVKKLLELNHTAPMEFVDYTFLIEGASRSFLAQMTRHRHASYCSSSQHYQNYTDFPHAIIGGLTEEQKLMFEQSLNDSVECYNQLVKSGVPIYEARQCLPSSSAVNLYVKMNARSLINFFNLRLCMRNTSEIQLVAEKMLVICREHFPELFNWVGPDCFMKGKCTQGKMACKEGFWKQKEMITVKTKNGILDACCEECKKELEKEAKENGMF